MLLYMPDDAAALAVLGEPTRWRIVALLHDAPRSVGEIAGALELRQPQATKHLQVLERSGLAVAHALGRRRIYALDRVRFRALADGIAALGIEHPSEAVLREYAAAISRETERGERDQRVLHLSRRFDVPPEQVWRAWTTARRVRRWWAPEHFVVADCTIDATPNGRLRIVLAERDGTRHESEGRFLALHRPDQLTFELGVVDPQGGAPLLAATYDMHLSHSGGGSALDLVIVVDQLRPGAAAVVAGLEIGWNQLLENLAVEARRG